MHRLVHRPTKRCTLIEGIIEKIKEKRWPEIPARDIISGAPPPNPNHSQERRFSNVD